MNETELEEKAAVVTGGAQGLGLAFARVDRRAQGSACGT